MVQSPQPRLHELIRAYFDTQDDPELHRDAILSISKMLIPYLTQKFMEAQIPQNEATDLADDTVRAFFRGLTSRRRPRDEAASWQLVDVAANESLLLRTSRSRTPASDGSSAPLETQAASAEPESPVDRSMRVVMELAMMAVVDEMAAEDQRVLWFYIDFFDVEDEMLHDINDAEEQSLCLLLLSNPVAMRKQWHRLLGGLRRSMQMFGFDRNEHHDE